MTVDVSLMAKGKVEPAEIVAAIEGMGGGPAEIESSFADKATETDYFGIGFKNPFNRRQKRSMRCHQSVNCEEEYAEHIGYGDYTYMVMGAHDEAPRIMRALAERFGGYLNDEDAGVLEYVGPASGPRP